MYCGLAGSVGTQGPAGYRWHQRDPMGVGVLGVIGGVGVHWRWQVDWEPPHWAPFQGPIIPTGFSWGVTYLAKAKQVAEMSTAGYYIHLELYLVTVCTFVSMLPCHIFLHVM